jgi:hypothetical protein
MPSFADGALHPGLQQVPHLRGVDAVQRRGIGVPGRQRRAALEHPVRAFGVVPGRPRRELLREHFDAHRGDRVSFGRRAPGR